HEVIEPKRLAGRGNCRLRENEWHRESWQQLCAGLKRRVVVVFRSKLAGTNHIVKYTKAATQGRFVILERIPGESDSRIEIMERGVAGPHMRDRDIRPKRGVDNRVQFVIRLDRVCRGLPAQAYIQGESWSNFPIILSVQGELDFTKMTSRINL